MAVSPLFDPDRQYLTSPADLSAGFLTSSKKSSLLSPKVSNRGAAYNRFLEQIETTPLNLEALMKPRKEKVPSYLKEVRLSGLQDYPDPKYFACKKFIARIPENSDRPSADALDLIVTKIYRRTLRKKQKNKSKENSLQPLRQEQQRQAKMREIVEEDDFLYLEFFGSQRLQSIREDTASVGQPKDRRKKFIRRADLEMKIKAFQGDDYRPHLPFVRPPSSRNNTTSMSKPRSARDSSTGRRISSTQRTAEGVKPFETQYDLLSKFKSQLGSVPESQGENPKSGTQTIASTALGSPKNYGLREKVGGGKVYEKGRVASPILRIYDDIDIRSQEELDRLNTSSTAKSTRMRTTTDFANLKGELTKTPQSTRRNEVLPFTPRKVTKKREQRSVNRRQKTVKKEMNSIYKQNERRVYDALLRASRLMNATPMAVEDSEEEEQTLSF